MKNSVESIRQRLRECIESSEYSYEQLARLTGITRSSLQRYATGSTKKIPLEAIAAVEKALGYPVGYIMGWTEDPVKEEKVMPSNLVRLDTVKYIPLVGEIACGTPILAQENIVEKVLLPSHVDATFALECHGDSMVGAGIEAGDVVFIREQPEVETGEIAAIMIEDCATLKKVYYDKMKSKLTLMPMNPSFDPFVYVGEEIRNIRIIGKAVAILKNLE